MNIFLKYILPIFISYFIGSINFAIILSRVFKKKDIRNFGSNNAGATNMVRIFGFKIGITVLVLDLLKGILTILLIRNVHKLFNIGTNTNLEYLSALTVIIGHCWPLFFNFRGGKAIATSAGLFLILSPVIFLIAIVIFIFTFVKTKVVGTSSIAATLSLPLICFIINLINEQSFNLKLFYTFIMTIIVLFAHRSNIKKILNRRCELPPT